MQSLHFWQVWTVVNGRLQMYSLVSVTDLYYIYIFFFNLVLIPHYVATVPYTVGLLRTKHFYLSEPEQLVYSFFFCFYELCVFLSLSSIHFCFFIVLSDKKLNRFWVLPEQSVIITNCIYIICIIICCPCRIDLFFLLHFRGYVTN